MFQSFLLRSQKKKPAEDTLGPPLWGKQEKKVCFSKHYLFTLLYAAELALSRRKMSPRLSKTAHATIRLHLDIEATNGQPGSCRARPANVDDGLEDIRWMRGLGGEKLPAASYALFPNLKKSLFLPSERDRKMLSPVFYTAAPKCVCIRRLAGTRHLSPAVL